MEEPFKIPPLGSELPSTLEGCHDLIRGLLGTITELFKRHQVYELPPVKLSITEYRLMKGCCICCGRNHVASLPTGMTWGITGPKLTALMSHLVSKYQLSRRELKEFLKEHYNFTVSLGTVFNKQKITNSALEVPTAELLMAVKESPNANIDETSHNRDGKKQWMWSIASPTVPTPQAARYLHFNKKLVYHEFCGVWVRTI